MTSRLSPWLTVFVMLLALPVLAADAQRTGTWGAVVREQQLQLSLQPKDRPDSHHGFSAPLADFQGLSTTDGSSAPFKLVREAGTFAFEGQFKDGQGVGTWRFSPDAGYSKKLAELGIPKPDADEQFLLASVNVGPQRVQALAATGQKVATVEELVHVGIFNVTPEYVRAMAAEGYPKLTVQELVDCRIHHVTPERIQGLAALGFKGLPLDSLLSMSIHNVTPDFVKEMRGLGFPDLSADDLVSMRIHGVTPAFVKEMRGMGYTNATADDFISMRIHGVDSVFVRSMSKQRK
ncbi:4-hydroxy-3-methylbut-2-enyl diphosphate reductase [Corallococcus macrosporus]|uniref:4-hydroxy-3-methylbut-2-enyl diphosphate reductase n=1 Tax=Corallococcus macrosporus TaxID=35 RepID=A0ABS3DA41_9BACT|nr:4-hydroxy-3-methylbut-2-enyl diphosphate reductase [Corallococcus macrosporus]MBN8228530.1 4-hydroxy-3-methylbut-2-enyl diphosphate reductase [Corallococcus macrosporus]